MDPFRKSAGVILAFLGGLIATQPAEASDKPKITFEIRRAETEPGPGLTETNVQGSKQKVYLHREAALTRTDIAGALVTEEKGQPRAVSIRLTKEGSKKIAQLTQRHLNKPLAILVNGQVISAPVVRSKITGENILLTGNFTNEEAERIAVALRSK
jgi:preprotein translocase subunit SecD